MAAISDAFPREPGRDFPSPDDVVPKSPDVPWDDDLQLINTEEYDN
jgi:hypothetical protein